MTARVFPEFDAAAATMRALVEFASYRSPQTEARFLAGEIDADVLFGYLADRTGLARDDVPTVLGLLALAGFLHFRNDAIPNHCARIRMIPRPGVNP